MAKSPLAAALQMPQAAALGETEAFAQAMLAALSDGLFIVQDQRFVFCNPALPALLGYTAQDFLQLDFDALVAAESRAAWAAQVDPEGLRKGAQADTQGDPQGDLAFVQRDGQRLWLRLRATPFEHQGQRAVLGLVSDMTEHRRTVAELELHRHHLQALVEERSEKAQAAYRVKSAFLATISHEIRTPLNAITGMVNLLRREASETTAAWRLKTIDEAAQHLMRLLDDVVDLSKVESDELGLEHMDSPLGSSVAGNVDAAPGTEAQPEPAETVLRREHPGVRVLVAEDNPVNQLLACELLQAVGLTVDAVDDGLEAIDMARRYHYALVLMDVQMPHLDGLQACRMIRALPGLHDLPIIAMTANAFREDREACLAAGMNDHVSKPVVPSHLYETLLRWL